MDALVKALPKFTTSATSETATATDQSTVSSSTISYTPTVTPPSPAGNPNIWDSDHRPNGTVFIAVGSIVAAIFLGMLLWSVITSHLSRRIAKKTMMGDRYEGHSRESSGFYDNGDDKEFLAAFKGSDDQKTKRSEFSLPKTESNLNGSTSWDSLPEYVPEFPQERLNLIQDSFPRYNRNSLFISPTIQVAQQQGHRSRMDKPSHHSSLSNTSLLSSDKTTPALSHELHKPERAASPERKEKKTPGGYHKRNKSSLGLNSADSSGSLAVNERKPRDGPKRKAPSMYLDDILKGEEDMV